MIRQKKGFLTFICSLVPGAGELYMGFKKQGVSIMIMFWGIIAVASVTGFSWIMMALPILWAYSFFNVHNLKSMPEDYFSLQKDEYAFRFGYVLEHKRDLLKKYRVVIAAILILFGLSAVWNIFGSVLYYLFPMHMIDFVYGIGRMTKNIILAVVLLGSGILLAMNKEKWQEFLERKE